MEQRVIFMVMSCYGDVLHITDPLRKNSSVISPTHRTSEVDLWYFFDLCPNTLLKRQLSGRKCKTPCRPGYVNVISNSMHSVWFSVINDFYNNIPLKILGPMINNLPNQNTKQFARYPKYGFWLAGTKPPAKQMPFWKLIWILTQQFLNNPAPHRYLALLVSFILENGYGLAVYHEK